MILLSGQQACFTPGGLLFTQECSNAGQDGEQGGCAEPRGGQRGLLRETHCLPLPVPLSLCLFVLLLLFSTRASSQAGADRHGDRAGAGEPRRPVPQDQRHKERVAGGRRAGQRLELGQQHQAGCGAWRKSHNLAFVNRTFQFHSCICKVMINVDQIRIYLWRVRCSLITVSFLISFNLTVSVHSNSDINLHKLDESTAEALLWNICCSLLPPLIVINGFNLTT